MTMRTRLARVYHLAMNMRGAAYLVAAVGQPADGVLGDDTECGQGTDQSDRTTPTARVFNAAVLFLPMKYSRKTPGRFRR